MRVTVFQSLFVFALSTVSLVGSLCSAASTVTTQNERRPWASFVRSALDAHFAAHPDYAVMQGRHEFDGQLPDWSKEGLAREIARLKTTRADALAYSDAELNSDQRFERDYLVSVLRTWLFWTDTADWPHRNPFFYSDALDPDVYVSRPYVSLELRLQAYTRYARAIPAALEQIKANLDRPLARPFIAIGRVTIGGLADFYEKDVPGVFASVSDSKLHEDFEQANAHAIAAVRAFDGWLAAKEKTATNDFALGAENFRAMIRETEGVDLSLDQLEAIGRKDLERNLAALKQACAEYAPGKSIDEAIARATAHKPEGSIVAYATNQLEDLRSFIVAHDLVTIPGTEKASVAEAPAYKRWNFAYINIPGPYEHGLPSVYYVAPPDPSWSKQKQDDYIPGIGDLLFTSAHEVWPGHFLQFLHANRVKSEVGRVFVGYAYAEGWAHYSEEMTWEAGAAGTSAEMHVGQILEALLRDARFVSAIGLHTKGMTIEESEKIFREQGHTDEATAEQQARRGTFDPAYLNYTMGKLMIRKLRQDWTADRGGRSAWKAFHDQFLQYGGPPIPLVRRAMMGETDRGSLF